jgi:hypothetical protein
MLKFLFIGGLVAGGLTIGFGVAGYVTVDGRTYHFSTDDTTSTSTPTTNAPGRTPTSEWQAPPNYAPTDGGCTEYTMPDGSCRNCPPSWGDNCLGRNTVQATIPDDWPAYCRVQYNAPAYCPQRGTKEWCAVWPAATGCSVDGRWTDVPPTTTPSYPLTAPTTPTCEWFPHRDGCYKPDGPCVQGEPCVIIPPPTTTISPRGGPGEYPCPGDACGPTTTTWPPPGTSSSHSSGHWQWPPQS